ncbi:MAG: hypothetical protein ACFFCY_16660, partial [Promethearchaeota archaeon]
MPILDRSKIRPKILKNIDERAKIQLKGTLEYLKLEENKGFNPQTYLTKIAEGNKKFFELLSKKEETIDKMYGFFTDKDMILLAKFFRFVVDYTIEKELEKYPLPADVKIEQIDADGVPAEWQIVPEAMDNKVILY